MDGWMVSWLDGWIDGKMDGWIFVYNSMTPKLRKYVMLNVTSINLKCPLNT